MKEKQFKSLIIITVLAILTTLAIICAKEKTFTVILLALLAQIFITKLLLRLLIKDKTKVVSTFRIIKELIKHYGKQDKSPNN